MILSFHPCLTADHQIILGSHRLTSEDRALIQKAEKILLPQTCSLELYQACRKGGALLFPDYEARFLYPGKTGQVRLFKKIQARHPESALWPSVAVFQRKYRGTSDVPHRIPFLLKRDRGHEGVGVFLISDRDALERTLENFSRLEKAGNKGFISQALVPSGGNVLRTVIMGRRTRSYWKRPLETGQVITTVNRGARIDASWKRDLREKGDDAAKDFASRTGINLAAVDFVFCFDEPDPQPFFLEVNYSFGRRGLGGLENYYRLLIEAVQEWIQENGSDPGRVKLV